MLSLKELMTNPSEAIEKLTGKKINLPEGKPWL
jgi:hypothetical protein